MVKRYFRYGCEICGKEHTTREDAEACESRGVPIYKFKIGEFIPEVDATVVSLSAINHSIGHLPCYIMTKQVGRSKKLRETKLLLQIERVRTCNICGTVHSSMEAAIRCLKQGEPITKLRWSADDWIVSLGFYVRRIATYRDANGVHKLRYLLADSLLPVPDTRFWMTEEEILVKLKIK